MERSGTSTLGVHRPAVSPPHPLRCSVGADDPVRPLYPVIPSQCSHWRGNPYPAPAGAEHPPPVGVSKEGGPQPSLFGRFKGKRFLRKGGNRNPPFLKPFFGYFLLGKKVTRRRQKEKMRRAGQPPPPTHHLPKASTFLTATAPQIPRRGAASPPAPPAAARSSPPRPRCRTPRTWPPAPPAAAAPPGPPRFSAQARCVPRR